MQQTNSESLNVQPQLPRARAILEFIEGDLSRPPIIYPVSGGTDEQDNALREEILRRWSR
jgi:hypothetical protein